MSCTPSRLIANHSNVLRDAEVTASSVMPSALLSTRAITRQGNGRVRLIGQYSGQDDTGIRLEIIEGGGTPKASLPAFDGVGSGRLSVEQIDHDAPVQELTFTLADLGTVTTQATLALGSVSLRAKTPGASGNTIRLTVTPELVRTPLPMTTLEAWKADVPMQGSSSWAGLGGLPLSSAGEINPATPRISFGFDKAVYRPYSTMDKGKLMYGLSPQPQRDIPEGAQVYAISGGYTVTVSQGQVEETYHVETLYDLLTALAASSLIEVAGVITHDRTPGGMAVVDLPLRTTAMVIASDGIRLDDLEAAPNAPTERVTIECVNADFIGAERWSVTGTASGKLGEAITGQPFVSDSVLFTVPKLAGAGQAVGRYKFSFEPVKRDKDEGLTEVCLNPVQLGVNAKPLQLTFVYTKRPPEGCPCPASPGRANPVCLGLDEDDDAMNPAFLTRIKAIYAWREQAVRANTEFLGAIAAVPPTTICTTTDPVPPTAEYAFRIIIFAPGSGGQGYSALSQGFPSADEALSAQAQFDNTVYVTSGVGIAGTTITFSNGLTGVLQDFYGGMSYLDPLSKPVMGGSIAGWEARIQGGVFISGENPGKPGSTNCVTIDPGHSGRCATFSAAVVDIDWIERVIAIIVPTLRDVVEFPQALARWDALWDEVKGDLEVLLASAKDDICKPNPRYLDRYAATCDNIRLEAGILPKSDASSAASGDRCWQDKGDSYWWVETTGEYAPAFNNAVYVGAKRACSGGPMDFVSTKEFAFGLAVGCPERLKEGDKFTFSIGQVDGKKPYNVGDRAIITLQGGQAAWLTGGVDGNDTQTWHVMGSVSGRLPDYRLPATGASYRAAGVALRIQPGGIPFELGDRFRLGIEAGQFRWQRDDGTWSAPMDIPADGRATLVDGLLAEFLPATAPSFIAGDTYLMRVEQPHAPRGLLRPTRERGWRWQGASAELTLALPTPRDVAMLALSLVRLPEGASLWVDLSTDGGTSYTTYAMPTLFTSVLPLPDVLSVTHVRLRVDQAQGGRIGWLWAGVPFASMEPAEVRLRREYPRIMGGGLNPSSMLLGLATGSDLRWAHLSQAELDELLAMIDHVQRMDEPLIVVPHIHEPQSAALASVRIDALEIEDAYRFQALDTAQRSLSVTLPLAGWAA